MVLLSSPLVSTSFTQLADFAVKHRLPAISPFRRFAEGGGPVPDGPDFADVRGRSASYVDRILKGTKAAEIPIEQPNAPKAAMSMRNR